MPPAKADKAKAAAAAKKIEDKTFGMKNKNKSKQIQQSIQQMKKSHGVSDPRESAAEMKKKAADDAITGVLFKEAVSKKDLAKRALEKAAAKLKEKEKEPDKRDIYTDSRDEKAAKELDDMSTWDDAKLREVVDRKKGGQGMRCQTDIICKHFLDAVEKRTYGWFWECPNGGDKCQYRHALPEGYVLKRDKVDEVVDTGPTIEEILEEKRAALTTRTPVTFERLQEWLAKKQAAQAAKEEEELEAARKQYAKGKLSGVTGKMLFSIDSSLFVDDAAAGADTYVREDSDDEDESSQPQEPDGGRPPRPEPTPPAPRPDPAAAQPAPPPAAAPPAHIDLTDGGSSSEPVYAQNYSEPKESSSSGGGGAAAADASAAAVDVADLDGVDESLFLDEDLPDDDEI